MHRITCAIVAGIVLVTGCSREAEQPATEPAAAPPGAETAAAENLEAGENELEVIVRNADGTPVTDADVSVEFYMPAMPSMNMAEMRNSVSLMHEADGHYRGTGRVMMAGAWDATVKVNRGGAEVASRRFAVKAQ